MVGGEAVSRRAATCSGEWPAHDGLSSISARASVPIWVQRLWPTENREFVAKLNWPVRFADGNAADYSTCNTPVTGIASVVAGYVWKVCSGFTGGKPPVAPSENDALWPAVSEIHSCERSLSSVAMRD